MDGDFSEFWVLTIGAAVLGILRAHERQRRPHVVTHPAARLIALVWLAAIAALGAETVRGGLFRLLVPLGAYMAMRTVVEAVMLLEPFRVRPMADRRDRP